MEVFSTLGIAGPQKVQSWNDILRGCADAIQVWPRDPSRFDGTLIRQRIGRVTVFEIRCSSVRLQHARNYPVQPRAASFQVLLPLQEAFSLTHGQSNGATVDEGSLCLIDRSRPYEVVHGDHLRAIGVELPSSLLEPLFPRAPLHASVRPQGNPCQFNHRRPFTGIDSKWRAVRSVIQRYANAGPSSNRNDRAF